MSYNDGYGGYGPYGLAYQAQVQPPPPPPPPAHPANGSHDPGLQSFNRGLNVTDPRFAAKYGNPYLVRRQSSVRVRRLPDLAKFRHLGKNLNMFFQDDTFDTAGHFYPFLVQFGQFSG
jgi:hypothetical protein